MGPRANWACLSKKCRVDGIAPTYELPVTATRCPVCGSKRIQRLYDSINVSSGLAKRTDALVEPTYEQAKARADLGKDAARRNGPALAVPITGINAAVARLTGQQGFQMPGQLGKSVAIPRSPSAEFAPFQQTPPRPTVIARDTEFAIKKKRDGSLEAAKA